MDHFIRPCVGWKCEFVCDPSQAVGFPVPNSPLPMYTTRIRLRTGQVEPQKRPVAGHCTAAGEDGDTSARPYATSRLIRGGCA